MHFCWDNKGFRLIFECYFNACLNRFVDTKNATFSGCIFGVVRLRFSERFVLCESAIFGRFVSDLGKNWICGLYICILMI